MNHGSSSEYWTVVLSKYIKIDFHNLRTYSDKERALIQTIGRGCLCLIS